MNSRLNVLILVYVHRYIKFNYDKTTDFFATKHPERMLLILPKETESIVLLQLSSCSLKKIVAKNSPEET